jgi:flagellar motor switch protein FliM
VTVGASRAWLRLSGPFADLHSQAVATLGHTRLTRQEIAGLSEGDVIVCDDQGIALQVAGVRHAAQIARIGTRRAIRICE